MKKKHKSRSSHLEKSLQAVRIQLPEGIYVGELIGAKREGAGTLMSSCGKLVQYRGTWKNNLPNGFGVRFLPCGSYYKGFFEDGKMSGTGYFFWISGDVYTGKWKEDLMDGYGKFEFSNGDCYIGDWLLGNMTGCGVKFLKNGSRISGCFVNGKLEGRGAIEYCNGDSYVGSFSCGRFCGSGQYAWADGSCYKGSWKCDLRDGSGRFTAKLPATDSEMLQAKLNSFSTMGDPVACYEGEYRNNLRCGFGRALFWDGTICIGNWKNDYPSGWCRFEYFNGTVFEGDAVDGEPCGLGSLWVASIARDAARVDSCPVMMSLPRWNEPVVDDGESNREEWDAWDETNNELELFDFSKDFEITELLTEFGPSSSFSGNWRHGKAHGPGLVTLSNGQVWRGSFSNGYCIRTRGETRNGETGI